MICLPKSVKGQMKEAWILPSSFTLPTISRIVPLSKSTPGQTASTEIPLLHAIKRISFSVFDRVPTTRTLFPMFSCTWEGRILLKYCVAIISKGVYWWWSLWLSVVINDYVLKIKICGVFCVFCILYFFAAVIKEEKTD